MKLHKNNNVQKNLFLGIIALPVKCYCETIDSFYQIVIFHATVGSLVVSGALKRKSFASVLFGQRLISLVQAMKIS